MHFRIRGLPAEQFAPLFSLSEDELAADGAVRRIADDRTPGYPCRVSLTDSKPGDELILVNHETSRRGFALQDAVCHLCARRRPNLRCGRHGSRPASDAHARGPAATPRGSIARNV